MADVYDYRKFNIDDLEYSVPQKVDKRHISDITYKSTGVPIYIQTPKLTCKKVENNHLELELQADEFYDFIRSLDDHHQETIISNSKVWFNSKNYSSGYIEDCYRSPILPPKRSKDCFKLKLHVTEDSVFYGQNKELLSLQDVQNLLKENKKLKVITILCIRSLWISANSIGVRYDVGQTKVYVKPKKIVVPYSLDSDNEEQEEKVVSPVVEQDEINITKV